VWLAVTATDLGVRIMKGDGRMALRELVRLMPGVRRLSLMRQRLIFTGSARYWERNYLRGGTSGDGSYGKLAYGKADFLNAFVRERGVRSVIEFGCGDGHQLSLAEYPTYIGLDVSRSAIGLCRRRFANDPTKSFFLYDGGCFVDHSGMFLADLVISLDVIYHLVEDPVFETYMKHLFAAGRKYVVIYSTDMVMADTGPHVRHRLISPWIKQNQPEWHLAQTTPGPGSEPDSANFFVYQRLTDIELGAARRSNPLPVNRQEGDNEASGLALQSSDAR
jgi:SAM-dependent methyltransferase